MESRVETVFEGRLKKKKKTKRAGREVVRKKKPPLKSLGNILEGE